MTQVEKKEQLERVVAHLRTFPGVYGMGDHDQNICRLAADTIEEIINLYPGKDNPYERKRREEVTP